MTTKTYNPTSSAVTEFEQIWLELLRELTSARTDKMIALDHLVIEFNKRRAIEFEAAKNIVEAAIKYLPDNTARIGEFHVEPKHNARGVNLIFKKEDGQKPK